MISTVSHEQKEFFRHYGYIEFEALISENDAETLKKEIDKTIEKCPLDPKGARRCLVRSIPFLSTLIRRRHLAAIAYELIEKKPLRLAYDQFFTLKPTFSLQEEECGGLLIYLEGSAKKGHGLYFKTSLPQRVLYNDPFTCYFVLTFTTKHLPDDLNPIVYN